MHVPSRSVSRETSSFHRFFPRGFDSPITTRRRRAPSAAFIPARDPSSQVTRASHTGVAVVPNPPVRTSAATDPTPPIRPESSFPQPFAALFADVKSDLSTSATFRRDESGSTPWRPRRTRSAPRCSPWHCRHNSTLPQHCQFPQYRARCRLQAATNHASAEAPNANIADGTRGTNAENNLSGKQLEWKSAFDNYETSPESN